MPTFYLYRLKAIHSAQRELFQANVSRAEFLRELISQKPSSEIRKGYEWHVGNVIQVGKEALIFAVGRTTASSKERYDQTSGDFLQVDDEEAPFTYALCDLVNSIIAISPKAKLSPKVNGIASSIETLFNAQRYTRNNGFRIEIAEIRDPEGFITHLREAFAVVGFTIEFGEPNPFDVEEDFHKPMENYLQAAGGVRGKTNIQGENLNRRTLEELARSVAATGNEAAAKIKKEEGAKVITKHMQGDPVTVTVEESQMPGIADRLLAKIREAYQRVRNHGE